MAPTAAQTGRPASDFFARGGRLWIPLAVIVGLGALAALWGAGTYNRLIELDQAVQAQWAQVENAYQRRLDLVPNLVETVKGAARFEQETFSQVAQARAQAGQATVAAGREVFEDPDAFRRFQEVQDALSGALSRLLVTVERYPELRATQAFRDLQAQLEGTENRIAVERMRFNEAARAFNSARNRFPAVFVASLFGDRFETKQYFRAQAGAETAPRVQF